MEPLPPIPTPIDQRWREFRIQILPIIFFICIVVALSLLWKNYVQPVSVIGEVEAVKANAASLKDGTIVDLTVDRFDRVTKGQVIGKIQTTDPTLQAVTLNSIAADLKLMKLQIDSSRTRNLGSFAQMKLNLLNERVALRLAEIHLVQAEKELGRMLALKEAGVVTDGMGIGVSPHERDIFGVDVAMRDRDSLKAEVEDRTKLIAQFEQEIEQLGSVGRFEIASDDALIEEAIKAKEAELEQTLAPVDLISPIDGIVSMVYHRNNERVLRGEPIATISASTATRIVGYLRQPVAQIPSPQDKVEIRTRGLRGVKAEGLVLEVGAQMEPINPALISSDSTRLELGLPVLISMPETLQSKLRPGQVVDLRIQYADEG